MIFLIPPPIHAAVGEIDLDQGKSTEDQRWNTVLWMGFETGTSAAAAASD
jgi:hypothetical protein